jgi:hypothetical protein
MCAQPVKALTAEVDLRLHPLLHLFQPRSIEAVDA